MTPLAWIIGAALRVGTGTPVDDRERHVTQDGAAHARQPRRPARAVPDVPVLGAGPGPPGPRARGRGYAEKEAWVSTVLRDWGSCGRLALVDDEPVGYVIYAPSVYVPGVGQPPHRADLGGRASS